MFIARKKWLAGVWAIALAALAAQSAQATVVYTTGSITWFSTYTNFGGGDITFRLSNQPASCASGYWMSKSQDGFAANLAFLLAARSAGETITVGGDNAIIWNGSASVFCRVEYIYAP
jgi:hypothetical protein